LKDSLTICITCAGNHQTRKPDAANPRQVDAFVRSIFQFAKDVTSEVVLNFGMAGDGLAKTCPWVLVPIVPSAGADKNATHFLNLPNEFFSLHAT